VHAQQTIEYPDRVAVVTVRELGHRDFEELVRLDSLVSTRPPTARGERERCENDEAGFV
jgi:hypothetical protein